jgi:hypothetical protein
MALIRGANSNFPCPVCLVPRGEMCMGGMSTGWTTETMKKVYDEAMKMKTHWGRRGIYPVGTL